MAKVMPNFSHSFILILTLYNKDTTIVLVCQAKAFFL